MAHSKLLLLFWRLFYGKASARTTGWWALITLQGEVEAVPITRLDHELLGCGSVHLQSALKGRCEERVVGRAGLVSGYDSLSGIRRGSELFAVEGELHGLEHARVRERLHRRCFGGRWTSRRAPVSSRAFPAAWIRPVSRW
jgi:hypothetical protein